MQRALSEVLFRPSCLMLNVQAITQALPVPRVLLIHHAVGDLFNVDMDFLVLFFCSIHRLDMDMAEAKAEAEAEAKAKAEAEAKAIAEAEAKAALPQSSDPVPNADPAPTAAPVPNADPALYTRDESKSKTAQDRKAVRSVRNVHR